MATPTPIATPTPTPTPLPVTIEERRAALSATLLRLRAAYGIPGISAGDDLSRRHDAGSPRPGSPTSRAHRVVTPTTEFAAGSISKTFTSALILRLAEEGRLSLDAPVRTYLPKLGISPAITIRQLLDHTSGLDDFFSHAAIDKALLAHPARVWSAADSLRYVAKPYFKPGTGWHYSNTNYLVLGMVAEAVGGAPAGQPAPASASSIRSGWTTRCTRGSRSREARSPTATASAARTRSRRESTSRTAPRSSRSPRSSPHPAAPARSPRPRPISSRWARALYGGSVLRPETLASMVDDAAVTTALKSSVPYGLGVQVVTIDGRRAMGHSGRLLGFRAVMRWLPDEGIAVVVMTNQSRTDPNVLVRDLLRSVIGVPPPVPGVPAAALTGARGNRGRANARTSGRRDRYRRVLPRRTAGRTTLQPRPKRVAWRFASRSTRPGAWPAASWPGRARCVRPW